MVVLCRGVIITGIMGEDEGIIGNGKVIMLYYNLYIYIYMRIYIHLVISCIHYLLNIYECNYINITIFNMCIILNRSVY